MLLLLGLPCCVWGTAQAVEDVVPLFLSQLPRFCDKSPKRSYFDQSKSPFWKQSRAVLCSWPWEWLILALFPCLWISVSLPLSPRDIATAPVETCATWEAFEAVSSNLVQIQHHSMSILLIDMDITAAWGVEEKACSKGKSSWTALEYSTSMDWESSC